MLRPVTIHTPNASLHELHQNQIRAHAAQTARTSNNHGVPMTTAKSGSSTQNSMAKKTETDIFMQEPLEQYKLRVLQLEMRRLKLKVNRGGPESNDHKTGYIELIRKHCSRRAGGITALPNTTAATAVGRSSMIAQPIQNATGNSMEPAQNMTTNSQMDDITSRLIDALFPEQFWRKFYNHTIAQRDKSMLSDTVTIASIDMYGAQQSNESLYVWSEISYGLGTPSVVLTPSRRHKPIIRQQQQVLWPFLTMMKRKSITDDDKINQNVAAPEQTATAGSSSAPERNERLHDAAEVASIRMDLLRCKKELMLQSICKH